MSAAFAERLIRYHKHHKIIASVAGLGAGALQSCVTWPSRWPEREIMSFLEASAPDYLPLAQMRQLQLARLRAVAARAYQNVHLYQIGRASCRGKGYRAR